MERLKDQIKTDNWKTEKHVPVIILSKRRVKKGEFLELEVSVGKNKEHPNTTAHHIKWISIYFLPSNEHSPYQIAHITFDAHGESVEGADTSTVYTNHAVKIEFKTDKSGTIMAASYCNIHGLWTYSKNIHAV
jgi:superoxide reductase